MDKMQDFVKRYGVNALHTLLWLHDVRQDDAKPPKARENANDCALKMLAEFREAAEQVFLESK